MLPRRSFAALLVISAVSSLLSQVRGPTLQAFAQEMTPDAASRLSDLDREFGLLTDQLRLSRETLQAYDEFIAAFSSAMAAQGEVHRRCVRTRILADSAGPERKTQYERMARSCESDEHANDSSLANIVNSMAVIEADVQRIRENLATDTEQLGNIDALRRAAGAVQDVESALRRLTERTRQSLRPGS